MDYILKKASIDAMPGLSKTHFLNPNAVRVNKSLGDEVGLSALGFHIIEIEPGCESTEYHVHYFEEECTYVLEGSGTVTIDEKDYEIEAGDFIGYPAKGLAHTMINSGSTTLRCIVVGQRLKHDVSDYPRLEKRLYRYDGASDLVDIDDVSLPTVGQKK